MWCFYFANYCFIPLKEDLQILIIVIIEIEYLKCSSDVKVRFSMRYQRSFWSKNPIELIPACYLQFIWEMIPYGQFNANNKVHEDEVSLCGTIQFKKYESRNSTLWNEKYVWNAEMDSSLLELLSNIR